jgi:RNA polymerase sigma factor (sigma-70 family)
MTHGCKIRACEDLTRVFREGTLTGASDRELMERYVEQRDAAAFGVLMRRHGPLVFNISRKLLRDSQDVEDAFQATFLVLIRKASSLRVGESLGPWISTVAYRVASRARAVRMKKNKFERNTEEFSEPCAASNADHEDVARIVHEEMVHLPERLRAPVVTCYVEGLTHERAAARLRCPVGTVRSRLARGRALLQRRLIRRGLTVSIPALGMAATDSMAATIPPQLLRSIVPLATRTGVQTAQTRLASVSVLNLVEGVTNVMNLKKLVLAVSGVLLMGVVVTMGCVLAFQEPGSAVGSVHGDKGPQGRREPATTAAEPGRATKEVFTKPYYVGDILLAGRSADKRQSIDMTPLIEFITTRIAPGTWRIVDTLEKENTVAGLPSPSRTVDPSGKELAGPSDSNKRGATGESDRTKTGQIVPFFLSVSLIVRHDAEVHEQVANLLREFRAVLFGRPEEDENHPRPQMGIALPKLRGMPGQVEKSPDPTGAVAPARAGFDVLVQDNPATIGGRTKRPAAMGSSERIRNLLKEIERELDQVTDKP